MLRMEPLTILLIACGIAGIAVNSIARLDTSANGAKTIAPYVFTLK